MEGRKSWSDIRAGVEPETLEQAARKTAEMLCEIPLHEVPQTRHRLQDTQAQEDLASPTGPGSTEL